MDHAFGVNSKNSLASPWAQRVLPVFFSFMVSHLIVEILIDMPYKPLTKSASYST